MENIMLLRTMEDIEALQIVKDDGIHYLTHNLQTKLGLEYEDSAFEWSEGLLVSQLDGGSIFSRCLGCGSIDTDEECCVIADTADNSNNATSVIVNRSVYDDVVAMFKTEDNALILHQQNGDDIDVLVVDIATGLVCLDGEAALAYSYIQIAHHSCDIKELRPVRDNNGRVIGTSEHKIGVAGMLCDN